MISFGSVPAAPSTSTKAASRRVFPSASVPYDTRTSVISIFSGRGFGKPGQLRPTSGRSAQDKKTVGTYHRRHILLCRLLPVWHERSHFLISGSARLHRHGEGMANKLAVIVAEESDK